MQCHHLYCFVTGEVIWEPQNRYWFTSGQVFVFIPPGGLWALGRGLENTEWISWYRFFHGLDFNHWVLSQTGTKKQKQLTFETYLGNTLTVFSYNKQKWLSPEVGSKLHIARIIIMIVTHHCHCYITSFLFHTRVKKTIEQEHWSMIWQKNNAKFTINHNQTLIDHISPLSSNFPFSMR